MRQVYYFEPKFGERAKKKGDEEEGSQKYSLMTMCRYESVIFALAVNYVSDEPSLALYFIADESRLYVMLPSLITAQQRRALRDVEGRLRRDRGGL